MAGPIFCDRDDFCAAASHHGLGIDRVASRKSYDVLTHGIDHAGNIGPDNHRMTRSANSDGDPGEKWISEHDVPVGRVE